LGRQAEARAALYQGLEALRQTGSRLWHLEIAVLLVDLETEAENNTAATELRQEARATLDFVLEHIPEGELRVTFAATPSVVQLFG
jgi:hypothetical protein